MFTIKSPLADLYLDQSKAGSNSSQKGGIGEVLQTRKDPAGGDLGCQEASRGINKILKNQRVVPVGQYTAQMSRAVTQSPGDDAW